MVISVEDLSASVWLWHKNGDRWSVDKVITIPAEPADADDLPPLLKPFGAVPPLVTDIDLSVDDRWLYVHAGAQENSSSTTSATRSIRERRRRFTSAGSCDASHTRRLQTCRWAVDRRWWRSAVTVDGCTSRTRCTRRGTRSHPDGVGAWMAKLDADLSAGGLVPDSRFFPHGDDFRGLRVHQTRLQGGDVSSDSILLHQLNVRQPRSMPAPSNIPSGAAKSFCMSMTTTAACRRSTPTGDGLAATSITPLIPDRERLPIRQHS